MCKKLQSYKVIPVILLLVLLTACAQQQTNEEQDISLSTVESSMDAEKDECRLDLQQNGSVDIANKDILDVSAGTIITQTVESTDGRNISIDAEVDVDGISRVSCYRYIPHLYTEEFRKTWFKHQFFSETWDVNETAVYNEEKATWEIVTPIGRRWIYQVSDSKIPDEQVMNLERVDIKLDYEEENDIYPVRISNEISFEDLALYERVGIFPMEIACEWQWIMEDVERADVYSCSYVHICGKNSEQPYVKALYRQVLDGMPVTVWHNLSTIFRVTLIRVWGSFFSVEEIGLEEPILSVQEAATMLQEQNASIQIQEEIPLSVTKITLEYLSVISSDGETEIVPVWRFWLGDDEMERSMLSERIFAVNAVSGELIWEKRGAFTE